MKKREAIIMNVHGNKGRKPANALSDKLRSLIVNAKSQDIYAEMNFSHFKERLASDFGINISYGALHSILKANGHASNRFRRRSRKSSFGELLQANAIYHDWLGTGEQFVLHCFIDDATDRIIALHISENESLLGCLETLKITIEKYGIPMEIRLRKTGGRKFEKILDKLGMSLALGSNKHIEKIWNALKVELMIFFKKNEVANIEQAKTLLPIFLYEYNYKFAVPPADNNPCFVPVSKEDIKTEFWDYDI